MPYSREFSMHFPISKVILFPYKPHMACNLLSIWTFHMVAIYFCTRHPRWNPYGNAIWLLYRYHVASRWRIHMVSRSKPHEYRGPCGYYRPTYVQQNKTLPILSDESSRTDEAAAATQPFILLRVHRKQSSICPVNICLHCICYNYPKIYIIDFFALRFDPHDFLTNRTLLARVNKSHSELAGIEHGKSFTENLSKKSHQNWAERLLTQEN